MSVKIWICEYAVFMHRERKRERESYALLERSNLVICKSVGLGNNRNQVDLGVKAAHDLNVKRLERMSSGLDEIDAGMDAIIDDVHAIDLVLGIEVGIEALFDVLNNRAPGVVVVDKVSKAGSVDDSET